MSHTKPSHFTFYALTSLFFIWGFVTALNDILIPHLKAEFSLSYTQAMLVQFCFFGAYFIVSPMAGKLIASVGYLKGIYCGLATIALGCLLFVPAASFKEYSLFLGALFVLASGITVLQVSANPFVASIGQARTAASRLNLAQAVNSLGHTLGPSFGAILILGSAAASSDAVKLPYVLIAGFVIVVAFSLKLLKLDEPSHIQQQDASSNESVWQKPQLVFGALAIFLYVGAEVSIGSFLVNYFQRPEIGGLSATTAGHMVGYYWGGAMIGRFIGALVTRYVHPSKVLCFNAVMAILLLIITTQTSGKTAMYSVIAIGLFNSIMFPTIFSLAIQGLGSLTAKGSSLLCQGIVGGALFPLLQAVVADNYGVQVSFAVPIVAFLYIFAYGIYTFRSKQEEPVVCNP